MQQYRVNFPLLIGLVVAGLVCSGAVYAVHKWQNARQSGWLLSEADKAREEKKYGDAVKYYEQYLTFHGGDQDTRTKYFETYLDLAEQEEASLEDIFGAQRAVQGWLRDPNVADLDETKKIRRRVVNLMGRDNVRNYSGALDHINLLLASNPKDTELQVLRATYLGRSNNTEEAITASYKLIGYDPKAEKFDSQKSIASHSPEIYSNLAEILYKTKKPELASRVLNEMIKANPNDATAYINRGKLLALSGDANGARADAQKAYQLKPENLDVLMLVTDMAAQDKDFDKAREYLKSAKKLFPKEPRVYQRAAGWEVQKNDFEKAYAEIDEGVTKVSASAAANLLFVKARMQIAKNDVKGAKQTVEDMQRKQKLPAEVIEYFDATILFAEGKWYQASEALSKLRARLAGFDRSIALEVGFDLAVSNERLSRTEQAQDYYEEVLQLNPEHVGAQQGVQRMKMQRGQKTTATASASSLEGFQKAMADEMKKPKAQQDWAHINAMVEELIQKNKLDETTSKLVKAQIALVREDYNGANKLLDEANLLSPKNLQIYRFKIQVARANPQVGPVKALELLQKVVDQFGDKAALRIDKADILIVLNKDKQDKEPLKRELAELLSGMDSWSTQEKVDLWREMAGRYLSLNMIDEGRQYMALAADNLPNDLPLRIALFNVALEVGDPEGMKAAQDKIQQIVGDQNDSAWLYAEAKRKLWLLRRGQLGKESLEEIRSLVKRALDQRPQWHDLNALAAEVEVLFNNLASALNYYNKAEEYGRPSPMAVAQHIRLLGATGRYAEAGKLIDRIPESVRQVLLGPLYAEILFRTDQVEAAIKQARAATESDPNNAANHYWYGQLLARSAQGQGVNDAKRKETMGQAIAAMQRVTQLQPESPDGWFALINYQLVQKNINEAHKSMRDAQLMLTGDNLTSFLARSYEMLSRWFDAETMYRELYEMNPTDVPRVRQLAEFYLGPTYPRDDKQAKATPLLNQIMKAGAEGKVPGNDANLLWARRMAAKLLATTGDYQNLQKATNLLTSNSQDGNLLIEDKMALAEIKGSRPEPKERLTAIALLEEASQLQSLNEQAELKLADLYYQTGSEWSKYKFQMEKAISRYPNSVAAREAYIRRLLEHNDQTSIDRATKLIGELRQIAPNYPGTFELTVRVADKLGKQQQVREELRRKVPDFSSVKELDRDQKRLMVMFARLFVDLKDIDSAEKIYRDLAARDPKNAVDLATFLGMQRSPDQCFAKLQEMYSPERIPDIVQVALIVTRERRDKIGDKFDKQIQDWIDAGNRENPDSILMLMSQADLYDIQKNYDKSADIYAKLLKRPDLSGYQRAVVLNNLAFLLALSKKSVTDVDPLDCVQKAAEIIGPNADILDTRAVVLTSRQQFAQAIRDLELSVTDSPTASKYFHKTVAHLGAGDGRNAVDAWKKAESLGLSKESLNRMEYELYNQTKAQIDKLRGGRVTQSEPLRKAG